MRRGYTMCATASKFFRHICSAKPACSTPEMVLLPRRVARPYAPFTLRGAHLSTVSDADVAEDKPVDYTPDELVPGPSMLKRIVSELESVGTTFILPLANSEAMQQLAQPLRSLVSIGVKPEFVIDACTKNPELFRNLTTKGDDTWQILNMLVDSCGITYEDSLRVFASCGDELLVCSPAGVQARLDVLVNCGIPPGRSCGRVVRRCPAILFARDPKEMGSVIEALGGFFSRKELLAIVQAVPEVLLKNIDELEEKYEYIFFHMCIEGDEFKDCMNWATMSLEDIMDRHEFLLKTGRYTTPDPKHPQKKMDNPRLWQILDSTDDNFAIQVGGVTREEWNVYKAYSEQLSSRNGKELPYERVKPSRRKAYERRKKEAKTVENYVFDVSAPQNN
uniref:mTERF domain-containing protein 1, mitochondrial n=1 Tax=Haemonchus contortus TaxID=6289 RepID=A0A7I4XYC4_HAECO